MNAARSAGSNLSLEPTRIHLLVAAQFSNSLQFRTENSISGITWWATRFSTTATLRSQQPPGLQLIECVASAVVPPSWNASTVVGLTNWQATELPPTVKVNWGEPSAVAVAAIGIDRAGEIFGSYCIGGNSCYAPGKGVHGYQLSGGVFTTIDFPGATFTEV